MSLASELSAYSVTSKPGGAFRPGAGCATTGRARTVVARAMRTQEGRDDGGMAGLLRTVREAFCRGDMGFAVTGNCVSPAMDCIAPCTQYTHRDLRFAPDPDRLCRPEPF